LASKKAGVVEGAAKSLSEVKSDSRAALSTCKDIVLSNLGSNEETKQALRSLVMMKDAVNASAADLADKLRTLMGEVEGVIGAVKRKDEEERRQQQRQQVAQHGAQ
jgi:hypothetical protein